MWVIALVAQRGKLIWNSGSRGIDLSLDLENENQLIPGYSCGDVLQCAKIRRPQSLRSIGIIIKMVLSNGAILNF